MPRKILKNCKISGFTSQDRRNFCLSYFWLLAVASPGNTYSRTSLWRKQTFAFYNQTCAAQRSAFSLTICIAACLQTQTCHHLYFRSDTASCFLSLFKAGSAASDVCPAGPPFAVYHEVHPVKTDYLAVDSTTYLRLFTDWIPQSRAKARCQADGGQLFTMNTRERMTLFQWFIKSLGHQDLFVWLSLEYNNQTSSFFWPGGEVMPRNSSLWNTGEPNNNGDREFCGSVVPHTLMVNDIPCDHNLTSVCEIRRV